MSTKELHMHMAPLTTQSEEREWEPASPSIGASERARSVENIREWSRYLPDDCIKKMIYYGWDIST
jgi:hypothetical protein